MSPEVILGVVIKLYLLLNPEINRNIYVRIFSNKKTGSDLTNENVQEPKQFVHFIWPWSTRFVDELIVCIQVYINQNTLWKVNILYMLRS